jgi:hypothetical protein
MRPLDGFDISGFEQSLLQARLSQYAEKTDLWRPGQIDASWVEEMTDRLDLVRPIGTKRAPTLAGWLLFASNPSSDFRQARVEFRAAGPGSWLRSRFGDDVELEPTGEEGDFVVRRTIAGNLWSQLDTLIDLLALVNFQFRLKAEVSRTVRASISSNEPASNAADENQSVVAIYDFLTRLPDAPCRRRARRSLAPHQEAAAATPPPLIPRRASTRRGRGYRCPAGRHDRTGQARRWGPFPRG